MIEKKESQTELNESKEKQPYIFWDDIQWDRDYLINTEGD